MQNTIVYPYSHWFAPFLRHLAKEKKYNIISAVIPGKWYEDGIDSSYLDEGETIGIPIYRDFQKQLNKYDAVLWANYDYEQITGFFETSSRNIFTAIENGKNIICCQKLDSEILNRFLILANEKNVKFEYLPKNKEFSIIEKNHKIIETPIITVMGISENCSKFETQLVLRRLFSAEGYKISQIGSRENCKLLDFHSFPRFMFSKTYSENEKIENFYNFVAEIEKREKPDIIIIGIPGGIFPLNDRYSMKYGITAFEVCNAIKSDFNILNVGYGDYDDVFVNDMVNILKYRFNTSLDCLCISNIGIDFENSKKDMNNIEYNIYDKTKINEYKNYISGISIYNVIDVNSYISMGKQIVNQLSRRDYNN